MLDNLAQFFLRNWFMFAAFLILFGTLIMASIVFLKALHLYQEHKDKKRFETLGNLQLSNTDEIFNNRILRYISMHLEVIFGIPLAGAKIGTYLFLFFSAVIGCMTGYYLFDIYGKWDANLPYDQVGIGVSVIIGLCASGVPFLLLHAVLQQRRAKLSHEILPFSEEFEKRYLIDRDAYAVLNSMVDSIKNATMQRLTYNLIQGLQAKNRMRAEHELVLFEHQIGTRFAEILCILLREALGITTDVRNDNRRENKDIRVGIRSLIEKMHMIQRVNHEDRPEKQEIFQIGLATFPVLYGVYYLTSGIMPESTAKRYLFEIPAQLNFFVLAVVLGFVGLAVNILISRRKFDL
ncbi:hypothetical protein [Paenibacillus sp. IITD108]|uniref:hypothetical protein n=1 Tax=Paenibacillus sp. IITD108 TaxID=3116649 RepID=UPI002F41D3CB